MCDAVSGPNTGAIISLNAIGKQDTYLIEKLFINTVFKNIVSFGPSTSTDNRKSWASAWL